MDAGLSTLEVAYLCAAEEGTDVSKGEGDETVASLKQRGLLDDACKPTRLGTLIVRDAMRTAKQAELWHRTQDVGK